MFQALSNLYTLGDVDKVRQLLLHSSSWKQHEFTAYGHSQIEKAWLQSISQFGFCTISHKQEINGENFSALLLKLTNKNDDELTISLIFEHNNQYIKRINCLVDTECLITFTKTSELSLMESMPVADPLLLSQFDHQLHPHSHHALPKDIADIPAEINDVLESWWSIWQANQMTAFNHIYDDSANLFIAGNQDNVTVVQLRNFKLKLINRVNRSYCQLEQIAIDAKGNSLALSWYIDGDITENNITKRVRIPVQSFLTIKNNKIIDEKLMVDWLAVKKRFQLSDNII